MLFQASKRGRRPSALYLPSTIGGGDIHEEEGEGTAAVHGEGAAINEGQGESKLIHDSSIQIIPHADHDDGAPPTKRRYNFFGLYFDNIIFFSYYLVYYIYIHDFI